MFNTIAEDKCNLWPTKFDNSINKFSIDLKWLFLNFMIQI